MRHPPSVGQTGVMRTFRRDGLRFDVKDSGPRDGPVVVCLHGFPQDATAYDEVAPLLVEHGFRVLVPDQRGYSPGARPDGRASYALRELVADVLALIDEAGVEKVSVVGHDWGGAVAWTVAGRHPDRVASVTALSTPHPAALQQAALRSTQAARSAYMAFFQVPRVPETLLLARRAHLLRTLLRGSGLPTSAAEHYATRMLEPGALRSALGWYRALPFGTGYSAGRVRVPAGFLTGGREPFFAPAAERRTGEFVSGSFTSRRLDDAGHWLPETRPHDVAAMVLEVAAAVPVR
jgi:pimeloyl-ACP methyl ester carboxylesterase